MKIMNRKTIKYDMQEFQKTENIAIRQDFKEWVNSLKTKIYAARNKLAFSVNSQVLELYWELGRDISEKQQNAQWGSGFIEQTVRKSIGKKNVNQTEIEQIQNALLNIVFGTRFASCAWHGLGK